MTEYISTYITGLGNVVKNRLIADLPGVKVIKVFDGLIYYKYDGNFNDLKRIIYLNNTFCVMKAYKGNRLDFKVMVNNSIKGHQQFLINKGTFRVRFSKENQFVKVDRNVTQNAEKSIQDNSCLRLDRVNPTTEIWYIIRSEGMGFYCQLLFKRKVTEKNLNRGELRPEFSNLMCSCIILNKDMIICDPFCGYGAIPKQLITRFNVKKVYASDLDKEKVDLIKKSKWSGNKKIKVFHANAMNIKEIADSTVDAVITDPPWGYYEQIDDMKDFYKEMLKELNRIVKENGKIVILTAKKEEFESICIDLGISISEKYNTLVNGKKASVYVFSNSK